MPGHITVTQAAGTWVARAGGAVLGQSARALELREGGRPPVIYFPRADIAAACLERTPTASSCPWKGAASYYSVRTPEGVLRDAAWSYEAPLPDMTAIAGHLAFYPDKVRIERA